MIELPQKFLERMKRGLGGDFDKFVASYDREPYKAIRVNTLKISVEKFKEISPFALTPVPWEKNGFYVREEKAGKSIFHSAGLYYVQEPSAMCAAPLLEVKEGERVLDLCSAPGGKGTQLAQEMNGKGVIVMNDVNFSRAKILSQNVERLGISNAAVISESPQRVCDYFESYFDKVLVDAPCSGEGMFLKEPSALAEWSEENVSACAKRQSMILDSAQKALKGGGLLVYSTCTFAPEEDEIQVEKFLKKYPNFKLISMKKLLPHECAGEGHFVALMQKTDGEQADLPGFKREIDKKTEQDFIFFSYDCRSPVKKDAKLHMAGDFIYKIMDGCPELPFRTLRVGVRLCEVKKSYEFSSERFEPCHAWAMAADSGRFAAFSLSDDGAASYLKGNEIHLMQYGWFVATYMGYPLGWCKLTVTNGRDVAKNHLPKGLRLR